MGLTEHQGYQNKQQTNYKKVLRIVAWGGMALGYAYGTLDYAKKQDFPAIPAGLIGTGICAGMFFYELQELRESRGQRH